MNNIEQLKKAMVIYHETYSPLVCSCGERYAVNTNNLGLCAICYNENLIQRALYSYVEKDENFSSYINWISRTHIPEEGEVDPTLPPEKRWVKEEG